MAAVENKKRTSHDQTRASKPKKQLSVQLKDGRLIKGKWIGSFGNRTTLLTEDGKQVDIKESDILSREELKSATAPDGR